MLNFRQLTYFVAVADSGSYTSAAGRLHVSQPALSARLKELEAVLRVRLFDRHPRGISLTDSGRIFLPHAREVIAAMKRAELALEKDHDAKLQISLGVTPTLGMVMLPKLLEQCRLVQPELSIRVQQGPSHQMAELVAAGGLDAALCYSVPASLNLAPIPQYSEDLCLVGLPDLFPSDGGIVRFGEIARFALVLDPRGHRSREMVEEYARQQDVPLRIEAEVEPPATKKALMLSQKLCAIVPSYLFRDEIKEGVLAASPITDPPLTLTLKLVLGRSLLATEADSLQDVIGSMIRSEISTGDCRWRLPA